MSYRDDVRAARQQFEGAVEDAAAEALRIAEQYGKPLQTVCKDIAGDAWNALRHRATRMADQSPARRGRDREARELRAVRSIAKTHPEVVAREVAKVSPDALIEAAAEATGQTRTKAPSNKAKVEAAFGPEEFNRLEYAIDGVLERLPDLAPNKDDKRYAKELAAKAEGVAAALIGWAEGRDVAKEVEEWLSSR